MKRTYIKHTSRKKARQLVEERALKQTLLFLSDGKCELPECNEPASTKHEIIERSSCGSPTDPFNCFLICMNHHEIQHRRRKGRRYTDDELQRWLIPRRIQQGLADSSLHLREHEDFNL